MTFNSEQLSRMTLDQVDGWYRQGVVSQDQFESCMHVWSSRSAHLGYSFGVGWADTDFSAEVLVIASEIRLATHS